jgi:hypothetical protein
MSFAKGTEVIYNEMRGVIDFICETYVVIKLDTVPDKNPARLLVFRSNYKNIEIQKASMK